jgi:hypothetical protein
MSDDPLSHPLAELGHISLQAQQLSQSTARLAAAAEHLAGSAAQLAAGAGQGHPRVNRKRPCSTAERDVPAALASAVAVSATAGMMAWSKTSLRRPAKGGGFRRCSRGRKMSVQKEMVLT